LSIPTFTLTNFERNIIQDVPVLESELEPHSPFPPDLADYVVKKIIEGMESGEAEIFAQDWIKKRAQGNTQLFLASFNRDKLRV
jgi:hypothetical protein